MPRWLREYLNLQMPGSVTTMTDPDVVMIIRHTIEKVLMGYLRGQLELLVALLCLAATVIVLKSPITHAETMILTARLMRALGLPR